MKVYGIKNCNSVKKALNWLKENNVEYEFHDFRKSGIAEEKLREWSQSVGWEQLVNKKGTTWRGLDPELQRTITDEDSAIAHMREKTSVIKRPVIEWPTGILLGFDETKYAVTLLG